MPKKAKRIPADHREPAEPWLLLKQIELDTQPDAVRVHLVDEIGWRALPAGSPGYVRAGARRARWCAVEGGSPRGCGDGMTSTCPKRRAAAAGAAVPITRRVPRSVRG